MPKTITLRVEDDVYQIIKIAAHGARRNISNFLECATMAYIAEEAFVSDAEMSEILSDKALKQALTLGEKQIREGKFKIVD